MAEDSSEEVLLISVEKVGKKLLAKVGGSKRSLVCQLDTAASCNVLLMESLREKFSKSTSYQEKLQILTLSPFTIEETQQFFQATNYMVKKSHKLSEAKGVLSIPDKLSRGYKFQGIKLTFHISTACPKRIQSLSQNQTLLNICTLCKVLPVMFW